MNEDQTAFKTRGGKIKHEKENTFVQSEFKTNSNDGVSEVKSFRNESFNEKREKRPLINMIHEIQT